MRRPSIVLALFLLTLCLVHDVSAIRRGMRGKTHVKSRKNAVRFLSITEIVISLTEGVRIVSIGERGLHVSVERAQAWVSLTIKTVCTNVFRRLATKKSTLRIL
mmetsp:Transcript_969/g.1975  ORF Transcript_969/g.1975 Transcript_969/m.1975 type:complete len:104 (-) Transcript_969:658-969(-)